MTGLPEVLALEHLEKVRVRAELLERLRMELIGPNAPDEELDESPGQRYLTGILWPAGTRVDRDDDEDISAGQEGEESGTPETVAPLVQAMKPSSIGLSFMVEHGCRELEVTASWGAYAQLGDRDSHWKRTPVSETLTVMLHPPDGKRNVRRTGADPGVCVEWLARPLGNCIAVSLFLVNRKEAPERGSRDPCCIFQPVLRLSGLPTGNRPFVVREIDSEVGPYRPPDVQLDELLYREHPVFAVGHGTAVDWDDVSPDRRHAGVLQTVTMPVYEVPRVIPPGWTGDGSLDMKTLAEAPDGVAVHNYLEPLASAYEHWILEQERNLSTLTGDLRRTAEENLRLCWRSLNRIRKGLDLIRTDPNLFRAFQFANRAMASQRTRAVWARHARNARDWSTGPGPVRTEWRPFQIAFILQALTGVAEPTHPDRGIADLLWFPTGGGKTEAYLGLAALVMALRRLRGERDGMRGDAGVTVLMRYTLRLLTIQQFQRAATLICACEMIRQEDPEVWGHEPFRIGLWVGARSTPNNFDQCVEALQRRDDSSQRSTPVQLVACPWCGSPLTERDYFPDKRRRRLIIGCSRAGCDFHRTRNSEGIPAVVTDEEIYRLTPALIIATVDKFARLPWVGETQALFGRVRGEVRGWGFVCEGDDEQTQKWMHDVLKTLRQPATITDARPLLPPDLVIQDELHLIAGPLGTMVGLYESAIDWLCSRTIEGRSVGPKIVASTATIRRAEEQVARLFARELAIFPTPGLVSGDSFFALEQPLPENPGRIYAGIFAPGRSVKTALVRVYAALLASPGAISASPDDLDPYQTMVGYFNSLRELGGAVRLIEDDVRARMKRLAERKLGQRYRFAERPLEDRVPELTSRVDSREIPEVLDRLERPFHSTTARQGSPVDVLLASNMISVGVDVPRLGLMVVTGQPKTTAEYIQATSRVGREYPGLVVTVYNWARPRDLSHYERFRSYHAALYRYVEALSVTPFSSRARDRALAAALVTMCRLHTPGLAGREGARKFRPDGPSVEIIRRALLARVREIGEPMRVPEVGNQLQVQISRWGHEAEKGHLVYEGGHSKSPRLLYQLGKKSGGVFATPNSMRDVEPSIGLYLRREDWS